MENNNTLNNWKQESIIDKGWVWNGLRYTFKDPIDNQDLFSVAMRNGAVSYSDTAYDYFYQTKSWVELKPEPNAPTLFLSVDDFVKNGLVKREEVIEAFQSQETAEKFIRDLQHAHRFAKAIKKEQKINEEDVKVLRVFNSKVGEIIQIAQQTKELQEEHVIIEGRDLNYLILPSGSAVLFGDQIGRGGCKQVAFGVDLVSGKQFALLKTVFNSKEHIKKIAEKEEEFLKLFSGAKGIVQFSEIYYGNDSQIILMPYYNAGELHGKLTNLSAKQRLKISHDIILGLYNIHEKRVIHADLKTQNILLTQDGPEDFSAVITDFGLSYRIGEGGSLGTPLFMSPERVLAFVKNKKGIEQPIAGEVFELANMLLALYGGKSSVFAWGSKLNEAAKSKSDGEKLVLEAMEIVDSAMEKCIEKIKNSKTPEEKYLKLVFQALNSNPHLRPNLKELLNALEEYGLSLGLNFKSDQPSLRMTHLDKQGPLEDNLEAVHLHPAYDKRSIEEIQHALTKCQPGTIAITMSDNSQKCTLFQVNKHFQVEIHHFQPTVSGYFSLENSTFYPSIDSYIQAFLNVEENATISLLTK